jgi:quercetin dioxygenase-like cupin family protein
MSEFTHLPDLSTVQKMPERGILTQTVYQDDDLKVILFSFAAGEELSEHTASTPALLHFISGTARLTLGDQPRTAGPGTWVHMPAHLPHSVVAETPVVMLLLLLK